MPTAHGSEEKNIGFLLPYSDQPFRLGMFGVTRMLLSVEAGNQCQLNCTTADKVRCDVKNGACKCKSNSSKLALMLRYAQCEWKETSWEARDVHFGTCNPYNPWSWQPELSPTTAVAHARLGSLFLGAAAWVGSPRPGSNPNHCLHPCAAHKSSLGSTGTGETAWLVNMRSCRNFFGSPLRGNKT